MGTEDQAAIKTLFDIRQVPPHGRAGPLFWFVAFAVSGLILVCNCYVLYNRWDFLSWRWSEWPRFPVLGFLWMTVPLLFVYCVNIAAATDEVQRRWLDDGDYETREGVIENFRPNYISSSRKLYGSFDSFEVDGYRFSFRHGDARWFSRSLIGVRVQIYHHDGIFLRVEALSPDGSRPGTMG
jgi:hypothetical protein